MCNPSWARMRPCPHSVNQSVSHAVMQPCSPSISQSVNHAVRLNPSATSSVSQSASHAISESISQSVHQSACQSAMQPVSQSIRMTHTRQPSEVARGKRAPGHACSPARRAGPRCEAPVPSLFISQSVVVSCQSWSAVRSKERVGKRERLID